MDSSFRVQAFAILAFVGQVVADNGALKANPDIVNGETAQISISGWGSDWYFAVCAIMVTTAMGILGASLMKPRQDRIFFYLCSALCFTAGIAYFSMGSNLGWTPIDVEFVRSKSGVSGRSREIFYVRYIDWFITTPMLLVDLMLTAGLPWPTMFWVIFLDEGMVVTGLVGSLVKSSYKWGYYVFGCACMFGVFYELAVNGRANAKRLGDDVHKVFLMCGVLTLFMWMLYPLAWGLCEGGNLITPNDEALFYGLLDVFAKPVFSLALIYGHWNIAPERLGLQINQTPRVPGHTSNGHGNGTEEKVAPGSSNGAEASA